MDYEFSTTKNVYIQSNNTIRISLLWIYEFLWNRFWWYRTVIEKTKRCEPVFQLTMTSIGQIKIGFVVLTHVANGFLKIDLINESYRKYASDVVFVGVCICVCVYVCVVCVSISSRWR